MKNIRFLSLAEEEMNLAALYYEGQASNLGLEFLKEAQRITHSISEFPELGPIVKDDIRRRIFRRFPFAILYKVLSDEILVLCVMHLSRNPDYWKNR